MGKNLKKFRKNAGYYDDDYYEDEREDNSVRQKQRRFDRALRTKNIDELFELEENNASIHFQVQRNR
jgi:ribosomal protein L25 (general stress protein Ctc)